MISKHYINIFGMLGLFEDYELYETHRKLLGTSLGTHMGTHMETIRKHWEYAWIHLWELLGNIEYNLFLTQIQFGVCS